MVYVQVLSRTTLYTLFAIALFYIVCSTTPRRPAGAIVISYNTTDSRLGTANKGTFHIIDYLDLKKVQAK